MRIEKIKVKNKIGFQCQLKLNIYEEHYNHIGFAGREKPELLNRLFNRWGFPYTSAMVESYIPDAMFSTWGATRERKRLFSLFYVSQRRRKQSWHFFAPVYSLCTCDCSLLLAH